MRKLQIVGNRRGNGMGCLKEIIDNKFSATVIGVLNFKLDSISTLAAEHMDAKTYKEIDGEMSNRLVEMSKEFFTQGFLRGVAAAKGGAV